MSKETLSQTQIYYFLIIVLLFLICVALAFGIVLKYKQNQNIKPQPVENIQIQQEKVHLKESLFGESYVEKKPTQEFGTPFRAFSEEKNTSKEYTGLNDANQSLIEAVKPNQNQVSNQNQAPLEQAQESAKEEVKTTPTEQKKAKLAIIIDDLGSYEQVRRFKAIDLKLTPSFFPPDANHKNTVKYASEFEFFIVHLPLEAINYDKPELDTLNAQDSQAKIDKKISDIKKDFKNVKYINSHAGSLFTGNEEAMKRLYKALIQQGLIFMDSRTIADSKAAKIAEETGQIYMKRDVFLDNEDDVAYIKKQLELAVELAHKKGFAIAIGHPRKNTFQALKESKKLLSSVELVYLSEIYDK